MIFWKWSFKRRNPQFFLHSCVLLPHPSLYALLGLSVLHAFWFLCSSVLWTIKEECSRYVIWLPNNSLSSVLQNNSQTVWTAAPSWQPFDRWCGRRESCLCEWVSVQSRAAKWSSQPWECCLNPSSIGYSSHFLINKVPFVFAENISFDGSNVRLALVFSLPAQGFWLWCGSGWERRSRRSRADA